MHRRTFLKLCGLAAYGLGVGFGTTGCTTFPKDVNWATVPDSEFSLSKFDDWFEAYKLYNGMNPNLKFGQRGHGPTFKSNVFSHNDATPGIDYNSNYMYAAADGVVIAIGDLKHTGRAGGLIVDVQHGEPEKIEKFRSTNFTHVGDPSRFGGQFVTRYAHLDDLRVEVGQKVNRGDVIGGAAFPTMGIAKLMLTNRASNYVDPDNYGINHSFMNYWDGKTHLSVTNTSERIKIQRNLWIIMCGYINPKIGFTEGVLTQKYYRIKTPHRSSFWDNCTIMKYLVELYKAKPQTFPNLSMNKFLEINEEFYANQPIILSLPLKGP